MSRFIFQADVLRWCYLVKKLVRERHLDRKDWNFLLTASFALYGIGSLALAVLVIRTDSTRLIVISLVVFFPLFISIFSWKSFREFISQGSPWKTVGAVILMAFSCFMFALGGFGYIGFINAIASPHEVHLAKGIIEKLEPRRRDAPRVFIFDGKSTIENIPISDEEYRNLHVGECYVSNLRLGGLGLYYRWEIESWNHGWEKRALRNRDEACFAEAARQN